MTNEATTSKRAYTRLDFSLEQEERLIDLVKENPCLYDPKDALYKNRSYRDQQWIKIGQAIDKPGILLTFSKPYSIIRYKVCFLASDCSKKWVNIRDMYNKNKGKKLGTGSAAQSKVRRNELMAFLDETVTVNQR